jgi:hypothetical protein
MSLNILNQQHLEQYAANVGGIVIMDNHEHNFIASDIPGIFLCNCGTERYYMKELKEYHTQEGRL